MSCQHVSRLNTTAATSVLSEDQDPYVFTETVPTTPPILFNAQKSRSKVYIDAHAITTTPTPIQSLSPTPAVSAAAPTIDTPTPAALAFASPVTNKRQTPTVTTNAKSKFNQKLPLGPLNGNNTKTQATSTLAAATGHNGPSAAAATKTVSPSTVKTTNSQSQKQHQQHKKALNVCIVRPQQQQQLAQAVRQQQNYKVQQQRKQASSPPPLFQHTPSLWQTPLLLDTGSAVVSPPTSPASLPSPPVAVAPTPTSVTLPIAAATAMVSPLITVSATTLPPSKFHHNTLAQHLQKLECIKKPKKPISGGNVHNGKPIKLFQVQQNIQEQDTALKQQRTPLLLQQQNQQLSGIGAKTVIVQPTAAILHAHAAQQSQSQTQMHNKSPMVMPSAPPPLQAIQAVTPPQHSDSDLNEIPVNVIFRKPQTSEMHHSQLGGTVNANAMTNTVSSRSSSVDNTTVNRRGSAIEIINKTSSTKTKPKSISTAVTAAETVILPPSTLQPFPHVLRDIVFTHTVPAQIAAREDASRLPAPIYNTPHLQPPAAIHKQPQNMSSNAKPSPPTSAQQLKYDTTTSAQLACKPGEGGKNAGDEGKTPQKVTDTQNVNAVAKTPSAAAKNTSKRKTSATATALAKNKNYLPQYAKKRNHKLGPLFRTYDNQMVVSANDSLESNTNPQKKRNCHAVAVVKMSSAEIEADTTLLASDVVLPYCIQKHWLFITRDVQLVQGVGVVATADGKGVGSLGAILQVASDRESQISHRKMLLRRQAMQLLSTQSLQKLPMQAAKRRLMCVDRLLRKYARHGGDDIITPKNCNSVGCCKDVLEIAAQCEDHIVDNISQHIFLPCTAKFADNTQCRIPVFDIMHDLPLCVEHARKRDAYNRVVQDQQRVGSHKLTTATVATAMTQSSLDCDAGDLLRQLQQIQHQHKQQQRQQQTHMQPNVHSTATVGKNKKCVNMKATTTRKRKAPNTPGSNTVGRPQKRPRKIGANGAPSAPVVSATIAPMQLTSAVLQRKGSTTSLESIASNSQSSNSQPHYISSNISVKNQTQIAMPALAPLSGHNAPIVSSTLTVGSAPKRTLNFSTSSRDSVATLGGTENVMAQNLKPHEINQLVAQFSVAVSSNNNNNNENSNSLTAYSNSSINNTYNYLSSNCDSNFTSALGSSSSLPSSTEELFRQELLSVCENSSAYASSEDTGLGGLSETELMVGPNDADDIPLGDTRLLEEHDLANVLSALPEDAFNELFTAVHQEEREEVERALELADKHLKSLQQTIGSDIDFLGEFPDDDEILADTDAMCSKMGMMHSPDATSGIDTSTLFIDSGSNSVGGGGGSLNSSNIADIRGLVQT
ncbi:uncharacterized protein LOC105225780 [Bactrocera dorsalis]|uniref:Uncharacterized protein LOC105225780 n=1 Tax=Bactrocera dorsalis TaxID=27457 RepID=A0A9B6Q7R7_BACDO|nr:uncharacterized protein LOC105225780 [Bactrocera dorsalis]XP_019845624.2 uncharacterized protein LOC105225780 [Bactrocera dorsalis]XP_019845625.2 uncharacterized protein LOC105225780 [Bactrocera dorsalis]XP_019845626.2 uncharacterized protein LOC105225780 [Bactrocera dorsalis]XP_029405847.2 uncharacterized protein LOC105225780 [Bactrocera dorsalis]XP_029405848.2 uncharacterized protein LOC105225780 [Bactrocera dorsalis]XP_029405851.2 uncharacterized protein LOC105225780 [Bactrocera dorsali